MESDLDMTGITFALLEIHLINSISVSFKEWPFGSIKYRTT
jgi:hypothetical protein